MLNKLLLVFSIAFLFTTGAYAQEPPAPSTAAAPAKKPPIFRPTKDQIMQVQKILNTKKLYTGEANGTYNDETRAGIRSFQKDNGLKETGTLNRATLEKFGVELTASQKAIPVSPNSYATPAGETAKPVKATTASSAAPVGTSAPAATTATEAPKKPGIFRATVDQIKEAQKLLKAQSMYTGDETGKLDDPTREGLKKYQEGNGLKVTGTLNAATLEKMGIALTDKQKADAAAAATAKTPAN